MQISNIQQLLVKTAQPGQFVVSSKWFIFQRKIISEVYGEFIDSDAFRIYLYLCKHYRIKAGVTRRSKRRINKDLKYVRLSSSGVPKYSLKVRKSLEWLEQERFIDRVSGHKQNFYRSSILVAPDYHYGKNKFVPCNGFNITLHELKDHFQSYIMVPHTAIEDSALANTSLAKRNWTDTKLKTLLLLYAYCWLEFHGGVDPQVVGIDTNGNLTISQRFCYALKSSDKVIFKTINSLVQEGHFQLVKCLFEDGKYLGDVGTYHPLNKSNITQKIILRPTHLIEQKLISEVMKQKKGGIRT